MKQYVILCGSAPEGMIQKKIFELHDFLLRKEDDKIPEKEIVIFPNGVHELLLENTLNAAFDWAAEEDDREVSLYLYASHTSDLMAELSDSCIPGVEVVKLGKNEIRKEVINYYMDLAKKLDFNFSVTYESDFEYVNKKCLGYETVTQQEELC